jgi:ADP-ribosylation factor GTPase-activating protein 1
MENLNRPDNLPPSQGGKYTGFGNSAPMPPPEEDPLAAGMAALSKGWGFLTTVAMTGLAEGTKLAKAGAGVVNDNVIKPAQEVVNKDPKLSALISNISDTVLIILLMEKVSTGVNTIVKEGSALIHQGGRYVMEQQSGFRGHYGELNDPNRGPDDLLARQNQENQDDWSWNQNSPQEITPQSVQAPNTPGGNEKKNDGWEEKWEDF